MGLELGNLKVGWGASCGAPSAGRSRIVTIEPETLSRPVYEALPEPRRQGLQVMVQ